MRFFKYFLFIFLLVNVDVGKSLRIGRLSKKSTSQYFNITKIDNEAGMSFEKRGTVKFYSDENFWVVRTTINMKNMEDYCKLLIEDYNNLINLMLNKNKMSMSRNLKKSIKKRLVTLYKSIVNFERPHRSRYVYAEPEQTDFDQYLENKEPTMFTFKDKTIQIFAEEQLTTIEQDPIELNGKIDDSKDFLQESIRNLKWKTKMLERRFKVLQESLKSERLQTNLIPLKLLNLIIANISENLPFTNTLSYYKQLEVAKYFQTENLFIIDLEIPILSRQSFDMYGIQSFPRKVDSSLGSVLESYHDYFLIERLEETFTVMNEDDLQKCFAEYDLTYICRAPSFFHNVPIIDGKTKNYDDLADSGSGWRENNNLTPNFNGFDSADSGRKDSAQNLVDSAPKVVDPTQKLVDSPQKSMDSAQNLMDPDEFGYSPDGSIPIFQLPGDDEMQLKENPTDSEETQVEFGKSIYGNVPILESIVKSGEFGSGSGPTEEPPVMENRMEEVKPDLSTTDTKVQEINCLIEAFFEESTSSCKNFLKYFQFNRMLVVQKNQTAWLFATPKKVTLYFICKSENRPLKKIIDGMGIVNMNPNCILKTSKLILYPSNDTSTDYNGRYFKIPANKFARALDKHQMSHNEREIISELDGIKLLDEEIKHLGLQGEDEDVTTTSRSFSVQLFGVLVIVAINGLLCYVFCRRMKRKDDPQVFKA